MEEAGARTGRQVPDVDPVRLRRRPTAAALAAGCGAVLTGLPLLATGALGARAYESIQMEDPGAAVALTTAAAQVGAEIGAVLSIGALVHLLFLRTAPAKHLQWLDERFEVRLLRGTSLLWLVCAAALVVLRGMETNGLGFSAFAEPRAMGYLFQAGTASAPWLVTTGAALVIASGAWYAHRWTGLLLPLAAAVLAVLAPVVTGHVLVGPAHDVGSDAAALQTVAGYAAFGALAVAAVRIASGRLLAPATLTRLLRLTVASLLALVATEAALVPFTLAGSSPTASLTGWFLIARSGLLIALILLTGRSWWRGRRGQLTAQRLTRTLAVAAAVTALWSAVRVAMTRVPPPQYFVPTSISEVFLGFETPLPPTAWALFSQWRPNVLFAALAFLGVAGYLYGVHVLRRRGDRWPPMRTVSWLLGWLVVILATSSGFGRYSGPDFAVHMIVHMALNMLAPGLLVLGGAMTLALRAAAPSRTGDAGLHQWLTWLMHWRGTRVLYHPLLVFTGFIASYYGLYFTSIFGDYMKYHWAHQLMNVHFLIIGYLYYGLVVGVDRMPRPLPHIGKLGYVLAAMPFHAFFGVILMTRKDIIAGEYYRALDLPWADLARSQFVGGGVAWAGGEIPLMIVIVVLAVQWARQDSREGRRKDRHLDSGRDTELDAYNQMMQQLAERGAPAGSRGAQDST